MKFIVSLAATAVLGAAVAAPGLQDSRESGARPLTPVGAAEGAEEDEGTRPALPRGRRTRPRKRPPLASASRRGSASGSPSVTSICA